MGNAIQSCHQADCFKICFGSQYKHWSLPGEYGPSFSQERITNTSGRTGLERNRIREYLAWALKRSHSPLIRNDQFAHARLDAESADFAGINSVSWISETGSSDASHTLYRELDPYNYASANESLLPSPSSSSIASDMCKSGTFAAVTRLTGGSKRQTSTSLVFVPNPNEPLSQPLFADEEVDGLELARLARDMWSRCSGTSHRHSRRKPTVRSSLTAERSSHRSTNPTMPYPINKPIPLEPEDPVIAPPVELDWDHEPGTMSPHMKRNTIKRPNLPFYNDPSYTLSTQPHPTNSKESLQTKLFPVRPRRHNVARLPLSGDNDLDHDSLPAEQMKRWSYSDKLLPTSSWLQAVPVDQKDRTNLTSTPPINQKTDELCDSGFVGLGSSFVDDNPDGHQMNENLLWENELFIGSR